MCRTLVALVAAAILVPSLGPAQGTAPMRTIFSSDSISASRPVLAPDGRWLVFVRWISSQETRLMIQPIAGGEARELFADKGFHQDPVFSPQGDRLLFTSSLARRGPSDIEMYLVAAAFDTRTGMLTTAPRQVALEPVRATPRTRPVISPDGTTIAYIAAPNNQLRVIPSAGGNARTLVDPSSGNFLHAPGWLVWSADGRSISYHVRTGETSTRMRVGIDGGTPTVLARVPGAMGPVTPDGKYFVTVEGRVRAVMRFFAMDGREVASMPVPRLSQIAFSPDGRYVLGRRDNSVSTMTLVPVSGGTPRAIGRGQLGEWGMGWSLDGQVVHISEEESDAEYLRLVGLDGTSRARYRIPDNAQITGVQDGHLIFREGRQRISTGWTLVAQRLADGRRTALAENVIGWGCCAITPAGGMYYGITGEEFYFLQVDGERSQVRAMRLGSPSRLIAEFPRSFTGSSGFAVAPGDRLAFTEHVGDSVRLRVIRGRSQPAVTIATYPKTPAIGEFAWSHDGRLLALYTTAPGQPMTIFRFDGDGTLTGTPQTFTLPFEYYYEIFWLRDGSGLTMVAQPRGAPNAEIALVRLADPKSPILLSKGSPGSKWGHLLSHDGKYVAYPVEEPRGSSIQMLDVAEVLRRGTAER
jgi:hypothetical protein